ncbi:phospholipid scramblase 3-like [Ruditapes philippinarum]|uniref:phospholipid scramblase 3-like n=1 Tax=Ruditapes philippinarum TaxID=129788 RepID=UPI00295B5187|nr:phospholipid scramblase 3-like [Ruditapes philippinarum]XP_060567255.1 phospholipid scramblase 3-like [Ruditapes philippinarum]
MAVVTEQPSHIKGGHSEVKTDLPTSLQLLSTATEVTVKQHIDSAEVVLCCFNRPCRYSVYIDDKEDQLFYVQEVSECYARQIMGAARGFALKFSDDDMFDIIKVVRPQTCSRGSCGICCTLPTLEVQTPPGSTVGTIKERRTCCLPTYDILGADNEVMYSLSFACQTCKSLLCCDSHVDIRDTNGHKVAELVKQANCSDCIGRTNDFTITYTTDLTVKEKVLILGAMFLVDFHHFERQNRCCC